MTLNKRRIKQIVEAAIKDATKGNYQWEIGEPCALAKVDQDTMNFLESFRLVSKDSISMRQGVVRLLGVKYFFSWMKSNDLLTQGFEGEAATVNAMCEKAQSAGLDVLFVSA